MKLRDLALAFASGAVAAHWLPAAQAWSLWWMMVGVLSLPLAAGRRRWHWSFGVAAFVLLGLAWGGWHASDATARRAGARCETAQVTGRVADLPARAATTANGMIEQRFFFAPEATTCPLAGTVRLSWLGGPPVRAGERWALQVRLRSPRGTANAHGFDAGKWHAREKLAATGYVRFGERLADGGGARARLDRARQTLRDALDALRLVNGGVLAALTLGDSAAIARDEIGLYRRTGTMHLLVISGLHVGVVTALGFVLGRGAARFLGLPALGVPGKMAGTALALLFAGGYVLVAGAGLSLVRAFVMTTAGMVALVVGRSAAPSAAIAYALAVILVVEPMAPLATGFWLSFGAVAVLVGFFAPRRGWRSRIGSAIAAQLAITLVFTPATVSLIGLAHPLSVPVNLVAVPVVTLAVVPLALAGVSLIGTFAGPWLLLGADFGVTLVGQVLALADRVPPLYVAHPGPWLLWSVGVAAACLLPVSRLALVALAAAGAVVLFWPAWRLASPVAHGEVELTALDVGQGTAVLVRTANHALLYDTGAAYPSGANAGESVVLPALRGLGMARLDALVLSHGDIDHVGGAAAVLAGMRVGVTWAGEPVPGIAAAPCRAGDRWSWDGVEFAMLHPPARHGLRGNNASCVLLVTAGGSARVGGGAMSRRQPTRKALLAGDIERWVEHGLSAPAVDWLLVPHHGSATSSTAAFVAATRPRFAVVGTRWNNRFGHPHPDVVARYRTVGSHIVSTAVSGALRWRSDSPDEIEAERCGGSPYWRRHTEVDRREALSAAPMPCW